MGVPVSSTRCAADMERAICARREFSFLSLCAWLGLGEGEGEG